MASFITSLNGDQLVDYVNQQLASFYPDGNKNKVKDDLNVVIKNTLKRTEACFSKIRSRYYKYNEQFFFNHLNGDHYSMFLYILSNDVFKLVGNEDTASKIFLLNKSMFGVDAFYKIELPEVFIFVHPLGTILGNAKYSNYFVVYQGVTIGSKIDGVYPEFSERTVVYSNSSVIGHCKIGSNCVIGTKSFILDSIVSDNKMILGTHPSVKVVENDSSIMEYYFQFS